jgi:putative addiction module component (TIGR02574 family)
MGPLTEQLFQAALALPEEERLELVEAILAAQGSEGGLPFDPAWPDEVRRRSAEVEAGTVRPTPWSAVRGRVRRRVEGRTRG